MGLFGVHMPTIYGEGTRAFPRLQEEILKRTSDQTLFAWGNVLPVRTSPLRERLAFSNYHVDSHLFAPSPAAFCNSGNMTTVPVHVAFKNALTTLGIHPNELEGVPKAKVRVTEMVFWEFLTLSISGEGDDQRTLLLDPAPRLHSDHRWRPLAHACA